MAQQRTTQELISTLYPEQRKAIYDLNNSIAKLKAAHPDYDGQALAALEARRKFQLEYSLEFNKQANAILHNADASDVKEMSKNMQADWIAFMEKMRVQRFNETLKPYGYSGLRALNDLEEEVHPGIVGGIVRNVYDKNDGGIQWSGVLGAVGGLALGMLGGEQFGLTGLWSMLAIVGGALLGAWLGHKGGDAVSGMFNKNDTSKTPSLGMGQSPELGQGQGPLDEMAKNLPVEARDKALAEYEKVSRMKELGQKLEDINSEVDSAKNTLSPADYARFKILMENTPAKATPASQPTGINVDHGDSGQLPPPASIPASGPAASQPASGPASKPQGRQQ